MCNIFENNMSLEYFMGNQEECLKYLDENWNKVPLINLIDIHNFQNNTLVRFYGMIQDMYTPEYFLESYEVINTVTKATEIRSGKYRDVPQLKENEEINIDSPSNINQQRQTFYMISLPGLNSWVENLVQKESSNKPLSYAANTSQSNVGKRKIDDVTVEFMNEETSVDPESKCKENKTDDTENSNTDSSKLLSPEFILNFPLADRPGKSCLLKVYSNYDSLKLNEMFEVVGFLSIDPILSKIGTSDELDDNDMEIEAQNPPPSLVPEIAISSVEQTCEIRKSLHLVLTQLLLGDTVAADYLICHLISTV